MCFSALFSAALLALVGSGDGLVDPSAQGIGLNVDFGEGALVDAMEPGEAGQTGLWNRVQYAESATWALLDHDGRNVGVQLAMRGASMWKVCPVQAGPKPLLSDGVHSIGEPQTWSLTGLPAGDYGLLLYARPNCMADSTLVRVPAGTPELLCFEADDSGESRQSSFHLVRVRDGSLTFTLEPTGPRAETRLSGLQLVALPSQLSPALDCPPPRVLACADSRVLCGLSGEGFPWVHPMPQAQESIVLWSAGRTQESAALRPFPWPGGRMVFGGPQVGEATGQGPFLLSLIGRSAWCQAYARRPDGSWATARKRTLLPF